MVGLQDLLGLGEIEVARDLGLPGQGGHELEPVAGDDELGGVGVHEVELLEFLLDLLLHLALELEGLDLLLEALIVRALRVGGHTELALDGLELLLEEVLALALLDLLVDLGLDALLDLEELLFLLDEDEDLLHAFANVDHLEDLLLVILVDVEDRGDEIGYLARVVDVDHVESHLLGEEGIVLGDRLHLTEEGPGERLDLVGVVALLVEVGDGGDDGRLLGQEFLDLEALERGDEDVRPAVGQVDALDDLGHRADRVQILGFRALEVVLYHHEAHHAVVG